MVSKRRATSCSSGSNNKFVVLLLGGWRREPWSSITPRPRFFCYCASDQREYPQIVIRSFPAAPPRRRWDMSSCFVSTRRSRPTKCGFAGLVPVGDGWLSVVVDDGVWKTGSPSPENKMDLRREPPPHIGITLGVQTCRHGQVSVGRWEPRLLFAYSRGS